MNEELKAEVAKTTEVLRKGGIILYPTDTIWGIGCDATDAGAVERIYRLKRSQEKKSMLVLVDTVAKVSLYADKVPPVGWELFDAADKPLTLILSGARGVADNLVPEEGTLGVRVVRHPFCEALIRRLNRPLVSTSANLSGHPSPARFEDIPEEIREGVDYVVDRKFDRGGTGAASGIIRLDPDGGFVIIRK